jgi:hypothetical protein
MFEAATTASRIGTDTTELVRLIDGQSYLSASRRVYQFPKEASIWVCVPDVTSDGVPEEARDSSPHGVVSGVGPVSWHPPVMMLPIHVACENLKNHCVEGEISDKRAHLEALVRVLVSVFPASCLQRNPTGQLPLHVALRNEASVETITTMLCAAPTSLMHVDTSTFPHLTPMQINNQLALRLDEERAANRLQYQQQHHRFQVVQQMLSRGIDFWNLARQEAVLRSKHRTIPLEDSSIGSLSVLAASFNDDASTLATTVTHPYPHFRSPPFSEPSGEHETSPQRHYPLPPALFARNQSQRRDSQNQKDDDPNDNIGGGGGIGDHDERKDYKSGASPSQPKTQGLEYRVDELVKRVVALEADKKSLQREIQLLHRELAKQDTPSHAGRLSREGSDDRDDGHGDPDLAWLMGMGGMSSRSQQHPQKQQHPEQSRRRGSETPASHGKSVVQKLQKEKAELQEKVEALTQSNREYEKMLRSNVGITPGISSNSPICADDDAGSPTTTTGDTSSKNSQLPNATSVPTSRGLSEDCLPPSGPALHVGADQDDWFDVDSVLLRAEQLAGHRLSQELVDAWRGVMRSRSTDSVSELGSSSDGQNDISVLGEDDDDGLTSLYSSSSSSATPGPRSVL